MSFTNPNMHLLPSTAHTLYAYKNLYRRKTSNIRTLQVSDDNGYTWSDMYTFDYNVGVVIETDNAICVSQDPADSFWSDPPAEIWRSTDGGTSFSKVLTFEKGGLVSFSYDVRANTVYLGEYGEYNSTKVYKSSDGGATWSTVFTHPVDGSSTAHIHAVHIDNFNSERVFVSYGDGSLAKGISWTEDGGSTWSTLTRNHQPTWIETSAKHVFFGEDLEGTISRIAKSDLSLGDDAYETVYVAQTDDRGDFADLSFYSGGSDSNGTIYFGGISYGEAHGSNNKDAVLVGTANEGETWSLIKQYERNPTSSSGPAFITDQTSDGKLYIKNNSPNIVEFFWVNRIGLQVKAASMTRQPV